MEHSKHGGSERRGGHYTRFAVMILLSFASMYALMYAMVDALHNVLPNNNQVYMAGLMAAAMVILELALMGGMYPNKRVNLLVLVAGSIALVGFWFAIRQQAGISDRQFLKSMIPHHGAAVLMCREAPIHDPEIVQLCREIVSSQEAEIAQMKAKLEELDRR